MILREAEKEADVIIWDGGNNDFSFYVPDLRITVADPLRAGNELTYYPGETNFRQADVVVINKVDSATPAQLAEVRDSMYRVNPRHHDRGSVARVCEGPGHDPRQARARDRGWPDAHAR